jgi:hypothetical protein
VLGIRCVVYRIGRHLAPYYLTFAESLEVDVKGPNGPTFLGEGVG